MDYDIQLVDRPEQPAAVVRGRVSHEGIGAFLGPAFGEVMAAAASQGLHVMGPPFGRYRALDGGDWDLQAGFPVNAALTAAGRVEPAELPAGPLARTVHVGDYAGVGAAYEAVTSWLAAQGYAAAGEPWECYLDGPEVENPRTEVFFPCRKTAAS